MLVQNLSRRIRSASKLVSKQTSRCLSTSPWAHFEMAPIDPIVGLNEIFQKDDFPSKVIVGVGSYRDDVSSKFKTYGRKTKYRTPHSHLIIFIFDLGWKTIRSSLR